MGETERYVRQAKSNGMKIIFEFPTKSTQDEVIREEVKSIMNSALKEQLQKLS